VKHKSRVVDAEKEGSDSLFPESIERFITCSSGHTRSYWCSSAACNSGERILLEGDIQYYDFNWWLI